MSGYILKFIYSMIKAQNGRVFIVFSGMLVCAFFMLNFLYSSMYGANTKEEIYYNYYYVTMQYENCEDIEQVLEELQKEENIYRTELATWFTGYVPKARPTEIPEAQESADGMGFNTTADIKISANIPVLDNINDNIDRGAALTEEDRGKVLVGGDRAVGGVYSKPGSMLELAGQTYEVCGVYNSMNMEDFVLPAEDLLELCKQYEKTPIQLTYWYEADFSEKEILAFHEQLNGIKQAAKIMYEKPNVPISLETAFSQGRTLMFSMIIAVLNFIFVYLFILKNRTSQYRVLKLLGMTTNRIQGVIFAEMFVTYTIAFLVAVVVMYVRLRIFDMMDMGLTKIIGCSYILMLIVVSVLFLICTRKFARKSPFASYQEN